MDTGGPQKDKLLAQALQQPPEARASFLETSCSDPQLRAEITRILERHPGSTNVAAASDVTRSLDFAGSSRFQIQRRLGAGGFGTVYQAWDRVQAAPVALKVLHQRKAEQLFRFKKEFRTLVGLRHPNLIRLYELFSEGEQWFFSMELVEGEDFLTYVRRGDVFDRVRPALRQLADGLRSLHEAKLLHSDVKPANALVTSSGRVVLLDFGLVRELEAATGAGSMATPIVGTPAYIAPEQVLHGVLTEASDWYSVGVMLFQALTGSIPHAGSVHRLWTPKQLQAPPPAPRDRVASVPQDLNDLCVRLLNPTPDSRPDAHAILSVLDPGVEPAGVREAGVDHFVGRSRELAELDAACASAFEGRFAQILVHGPSGIGKTTLMRHFLARLSERTPNLLALNGACYEFESVPYKGLDVLVDLLSEHLQRLPASLVEPLLARDASLLPRLFPVLARVPAIAEAPARGADVPDAQELRQRGFRALRELLARLGERQPLLLWIDDVQWADRDSITLLAELCAPPERPPLLLVLSYRREERTNPVLLYLHELLAHQGPGGVSQELALDQLSSAESAALLQELLSARSDVPSEVLDHLIREADGHPLFLQELARSAGSQAGGPGLAHLASSDLALRDVIQRRASGLPSFVREVLEFVCIATQPVGAPVVLAAPQSRTGAERAHALALLIREHLIRSSGSSDDRLLEPYHDQVRAAVLSMMAPDVRRSRHGRLARVLSEIPDIEPQLLVTHYREGGDPQAAFESALKAAELAERQLAFERAAALYEAALATGDMARTQRASITRRLATMLGMAGRGRDSADAYLASAALEGGENFELQRLATDQLMRSGYIDEGLDHLERLTAGIGIPTVRTPAQAVRHILLGRVRARLLLLRGIPSPRTSVGEKQLARLELLRTGAVVLNAVDPVMSAFFQTRHIAEALRFGDATHLSIALAMEGSIRLAGRNPDTRTAFALIDAADRLAAASGHRNSIAFILLVRAYCAYLRCDVPDGIAHARAAIAYYREHCTGVTWETTTAHAMLYWFLCWAGYGDQVLKELPGLLKDGAARGDMNLQVSLRLIAYTHYAYLSLDRAEECLRECHWALARWSRRGFHLQNFGAMFNLAESCLYLGDCMEARKHIMNNWPRMTRSLFLRWEVLRVVAWFQRGRVSLACWAQNPGDASLAADVRRCIARLKRTNLPWSAPMRTTLEAGLAAGEQRTADAIRLLHTAAEGYEGVSLGAMAAAARYFAGTLEGGDSGRVRVNVAVEFFEAQGVVKPHAFVRMLLPGRWTGAPAPT
jgi:hypothetical protein